jgi:hypothetical protein
LQWLLAHHVFDEMNTFYFVDDNHLIMEELVGLYRI